MTKLAIITVTYNSAAVIDEFLGSLLRQTFFDWHLYLVDSASIDETLIKVGMVKDNRITVLPQKNNVGFANGNNIGIEQARVDGYKELLLINNDTIFDSDFLTKLLRSRKQYPTAVLAPKIYYPDNKTIWCAGGGFKPFQAYAAYHRGENEIDNGQYDCDYSCDFVPMCCVLIPARIWNKVGELDEKYFIYSEDADWFYRASLLKVKLWYCFESSLIHKVSSLTGGAQSATGAFYGSRNRIYFLRKHFSGARKLRYIATYLGGMWWKLIWRRYHLREFLWRIKGSIDGFYL